MSKQLSETHKIVFKQRLHPFLDEVIDLANTQKDITRIMETLAKQKTKLEHEHKVQQVEGPAKVDKKAINAEIKALIQ